MPAYVSPAEPAPVAPTTALHLARRFAAPREEVFRAWTEPELVRQWLTPPGGRSPSAELEVRPGGSYRVAMKLPVGPTFYAVGTYLEVEPPERLVFTWHWEPRNPLPAAGMADSTVTVVFSDLGEETEVKLTHARLDKRRLRAFHRFGWTHGWDELVQLLGQR